MSTAEELGKLKALKDEGALTEEEFTRAKAVLLTSPPMSVQPAPPAPAAPAPAAPAPAAPAPAPSPSAPAAPAISSPAEPKSRAATGKISSGAARDRGSSRVAATIALLLLIVGVYLRIDAADQEYTERSELASAMDLANSSAQLLASLSPKEGQEAKSKVDDLRIHGEGLISANREARDKQALIAICIGVIMGIASFAYRARSRRSSNP